MDNHSKKKIAPIIITVFLLIYYCAYFGIIISVLSPVLKIVVGIVPAILGGMSIYVCSQRIKEIDGGEEDDLSKY